MQLFKIKFKFSKIPKSGNSNAKPGPLVQAVLLGIFTIQMLWCLKQNNQFSKNPNCPFSRCLFWLSGLYRGVMEGYRMKTLFLDLIFWRRRGSKITGWQNNGFVKMFEKQIDRSQSFDTPNWSGSFPNWKLKKEKNNISTIIPQENFSTGLHIEAW